MCSCEYCVQMEYYQNALNCYGKELIHKVEKDINKMRTNNNQQRRRRKKNWKQNSTWLKPLTATNLFIKIVKMQLCVYNVCH